MAAKIMEAHTQHLESLGNGAIQDYASYRDTVGYLRGLKDAMALCEEIDKGKD